ncbi:class I SAM-dependent methyltransferase [Pseudoalteromonas tunicata]|jgi:hypothetical protein|uniref:Putative orphan protein n=1 Tax=Pseudoalteromonas tunicata D2 TaxID=87626 RepID=A4C6V1_9GAMM|nr:class I SAM-dependent methyltransferase [Pseudoalteromonas tunicata]ATC95674.1 hypothetical protein PTUN_a3326 [Pseudoalteromonas tunicata]AXT31237.1 DUF2431 domain-containing protein [Pseudoalteromonas tunicata]EAR29705.1 putative orphan protein [Pseudoalteromonas tunicata D2]
MIINPDWRILTIGDGDLSFSAALWQHHKPHTLCATVLDSRTTLLEKYSDNQLDFLEKNNITVLTDFDVTNSNTWQGISYGQFDLVIFQFPLVPAFNNAALFFNECEHISVNTLNRILLRHFLLNCFKHFLDPAGQRLALITSKDVKPYSHWNIETALVEQTELNYLGKTPFDITQFDGYKVRNVDRDKHVKETQGWSYIFSDSDAHLVQQHLIAPLNCSNGCCWCQITHFQSEIDKTNHLASKRHREMAKFSQQWQWALAHHTSFQN